MTDLKRLIRYEEKQKRIEAHVQYANKHYKFNKAETTEITQDIQERKNFQHNGRQRHISADSSYSTATSEEYDSDEAPKKAKIVKGRPQSSSYLTRSSTERYTRNENSWKRQDERNNDRNDLPLNNIQNIISPNATSGTREGYATMDVIRSRRYSEARETLGESTAEEYQIQIQLPQNIPTKTFKKPSKENVRPISAKSTAVGSKESRADFDGGCWEMVNQDAVQILPPKPKIPTKPTTSCIKPTFNEKQKKDLRRDPVRLHDYYKKQWEKLKLPGDESRSTKELRWAVREWMMGRKPPE